MFGPARYAVRGWKIFPCVGKIPAVSDWRSATKPSISQMRNWLTNGKNLGLPMSANGLVCIDVDAKGLDAWTRLLAEKGEPLTLKARTGSGNGFHYIFKAEPGVKYRGKLCDGVDVKHNGYIVIPPSTHPTTGLHYEWLNEENNGPMPEWLAEQVTRTEADTPTPKVTLGFDELRKLIVDMKTLPLTYEQWVQCGMAIHSATKGEGLDLWLDLTSGISYREGDEELAIQKWNGFRADGAIGAGTLRHVLRSIKGEGGADDFAEVDDTAVLNAEGWCVMASGMITKVHADRDISTFGMERFRTIMANRTTKVVIDGETKRVNLGRKWLESPGRKQYRNVVFRPIADPQDLNTWTPIPCEPNYLGDGLGEVLEFIQEAVCRGQDDLYQYFMNWCAQLVQQPEHKCTIVPALIGEQGTGKGLMTDGLLAGILKKYYVRLDKPGIITERFNVEQSRKFLTVLDESTWRGRNELSNVLKSLTGNDSMTVEEKFGGRYSIENFSRYMLTSNDVEAVKIEKGNRRYLVVEMSAEHKHLCGPVWESIRAGVACPVFYGWLLRRDIRGFNIHQFPEKLDIHGHQTKVRSMGEIGEFWDEILLGEPQRVWITKFELDKTAAFAAFTRMFPRKLTNPRWFWFQSTVLIPALEGKSQRPTHGGERRYVYTVTPEEAQGSFCRANRLIAPLDAPSYDEYVMTDSQYMEGDF